MIQREHATKRVRQGKKEAQKQLGLRRSERREEMKILLAQAPGAG